MTFDLLAPSDNHHIYWQITREQLRAARFVNRLLTGVVKSAYFDVEVVHGCTVSLALHLREVCGLSFIS